MEVVVCLVLLFIGVGVFTFIHVCIVGRAFGSISGESFNPRDMNNTGRRRSSSMSQEDIKKLPCFEYKLEDEEESGTGAIICAVCLENLKNGDKCRVLPKCKHCFHAQCIEPWLITSGACPICRAATKTPPFTTSSIGEESSNNNSNQIVIELT
ncbi:PREDICTED: RING-H2 finger protein ATL39-like [Ipomoea nil]|uniref:RING-H2 finger protein ATL39-like n=1 Tax=Ipomoea nil TaxID=35883 RepID=UPI000901B561|nr:PREDICTED: RING-H2 finger protein ATL39-like [Ipomoea nil]